MSNLPLIIVHMPTNPNCVCNLCVPPVAAAGAPAIPRLHPRPFNPYARASRSLPQAAIAAVAADPVDEFASIDDAAILAVDLTTLDLPVATAIVRHSSAPTTPSRRRRRDELDDDYPLPDPSLYGPAVPDVTATPETNTPVFTRVTPSATSPCFHTALPVTHAAAIPQGAFRLGAHGTGSILQPRAYGNLVRVDRSLLNDIAALSGTTKFRVATYNVSNEDTAIVGRHTATASDILTAHSMSSLGVHAGHIASGMEAFLAPIVRQAFSPQLQQVGCVNLHNASHFVRRERGSDTLSPFANQRGNVLFTPVMVTNTTVCIKNNNGDAEFYPDATKPNGLRYNTKFWSGHASTKFRRSTNTKFSTVEFGMLMPLWTIPPVDQHSHNEAVTFLAGNGGYIPHSNVGYLSLKSKYSFAFLKWMTSSIVARAREAGWSPLFLIKNVLLQRNDVYGVRDHIFTSIDLQPRSYLALVGFFKGTTATDVSVITINNSNNELLSLDIA